jgi:hypothetical protein
MNKVLYIASFIEQEIGSSMQNTGSAPEDAVDRVIIRKMKIGSGKMIQAGITDHLFMFPQGISACDANPWKNQTDKIICPHDT